MPNGLAEGLTTQDFADLIAYLETLEGSRDRPSRDQWASRGVGSRR